MQNPFAIAVEWPNQPRCYLIHMQRPYFTAALCETPGTMWLLVSWVPGARVGDKERATLFLAAAEFCRASLGRARGPMEFVERKHGHHLPRFLMAQTPGDGLFIVEPDHAAPLVEVRDRAAAPSSSTHRQSKLSQRFDVITQWRLAEMRKYYQQYLERQKAVVNSSHLAAMA